jgi:hypothetical protein
MERLERFIKAVEYLKPLAAEATNEGVSRLLKYKSSNYISDIIGGSKPLTPFVLERMVEYSINPDWIETGKGSMLMPAKLTEVKKDPSNILLDTSTINVTLQDYIDLLKAMNTKEEERGKELISIIKDMAAGQKAITEALQPLKEQTQEILVNSKEVRENMTDAIIEMQSEHRVIMDGLDQVLKQPIGTTFGKADTLEGASQEVRAKGRIKKSAHKQSKEG